MANNINMYRFPIDFLTCLIFKLMSNFKEMKKALALVGLLGVISCNTNNQDTPAVVGDNTEGIRDYKTYCNPIDIDYSYMSHYRAENKVSYRSGADPAVVNFKGRYYMFVTRSHGYWASDDMLNWKFIRPQSWYFHGLMLLQQLFTRIN